MSGRGKYIVLEGDEGSGKTTQLERVSRRLRALGHPVKVVREPGGDPFAERLRDLLKHADFPISPVAETLAFSAARANMIAQVVKPHLDSGTWVLSDRSFLSTLVYQGRGKGLESPEFRKVVKYAVTDARPDLIIVINISLAESHRRQDKRGLVADRFDLGDDFRARINHSYQIVRASRSNLVHIDGEGTEEQVERRIMAKIRQYTA